MKRTVKKKTPVPRSATRREIRDVARGLIKEAAETERDARREDDAAYARYLLRRANANREAAMAIEIYAEGMKFAGRR